MWPTKWRLSNDLESQRPKGVEYHPLKMETFVEALELVAQNCQMASIDMKEAYYSVLIHSEFRKYLRFEWRNSLLQFTALPNGLANGPRKYSLSQ